MIYLIIDTCTSNLVISICNGNKIIKQIIKKNDGSLSTNFTQLISDILDDSNIKVDNINTIFVSNGPGSFTGIRIGVTFAKVLAWSKNIKVVPFSSLEMMASGIESKYIVPMLDARRGYVYSGIYDEKLNVVKDDSYIKLNDLLEITKKYNDVTYVSCDLMDISSIIPKYDVVKLIDKHKNDSGLNPHLLNPNYLKKTEAEEKNV